MSGRNWWVIILAGWVAVIIASSFYGDPRDFLVVRKVHVFDAIEGHSPKMDVERVIRKPFRGEWLADVSRREGSGFYAVCSGSGKSNYDPADRLPAKANLDLDWWTYPVRCNLPVGCYEVNTVWTIEAPNVPAMAVRSVSNEFCIKPRR
jgi:hypothetical protein